MWFEDWTRLGQLLLASVCAYGALVVVLRLSGKRTLAKLNAFDFIVTIALGSVLATVVVSRDIPLLEGVAALVSLVLLQFAVAAATTRWPWLRPVVTSTPTALVRRGRLDDRALARSRISPEEVAAAVRRAGFGSFADVEVVVLETDGTLSVIPAAGDGTALDDVAGLVDDGPGGSD